VDETLCNRQSGRGVTHGCLLGAARVDNSRHHGQTQASMPQCLWERTGKTSRRATGEATQGVAARTVPVSAQTIRRCCVCHAEECCVGW
jgi:hypothetical protein